jgi:hypothetical protein
MTSRQYAALAAGVLALAVATGPVAPVGAQPQTPVRVPKAVLER